MKRKKLEIELVGGLGNQLFGYYAGKYFQHLLQSDLTLNFNGIMKGIKGDSDIRSFNLETQRCQENALHDSKIMENFRKVRDKLILEDERFTFLFYPRTQLIIDSEIFGENVSESGSKYLAKGYFGNFDYFYSVQELVPKLELVQQSKSFTILSEEAKSIEPIVVHVRRGDYVHHSEVYGLLGDEYYFNAIKYAREIVGERQIWFFSDDLETANQIAKRLKVDFRLIESEYILSSAEIILLQSQASANVIANSTFSAWGAALNTTSGVKICPDRYFFDNRETPHWPPRDWRTVPTGWN